MRRIARRAAPVFALVLLAVCLSVAGAVAQTPPGAVPMELQLIPAQGTPRPITAWERDGVLFVSAHAVAELLDADEYWRAELGRLTFATERHEMTVFEGTELAMIDATTLRHLPDRVFMWGDELLIPLDLIVDEAGEPRSWIPKAVRFSREDRRLSAARHEGVVTDAHIEAVPMGWKLVIAGDRAVRTTISRAERASFVLRIYGLEYDPLLYPLPSDHEWFQGLRVQNLSDGLEVSFTPDARALGYRVTSPSRDRVEILLGVDERDLREGTIQPFSTRVHRFSGMPSVIAIDPGHGGADPGATLDGSDEAHLAHDLALRVAEGLTRDMGVDVVVTREEDRGPDEAARIAAAESYDADLLISIHLHDRPGGPAAFTATAVGDRNAPPPELAALGFRAPTGGQTLYIPASRLLARTVLDAVAAALDEPAQGVFAEDLPLLQGVAMPAALVEIGRGDGETEWNDETLDRIAEGIVEGVRLYVLFDEEIR